LNLLKSRKTVAADLEEAKTDMTKSSFMAGNKLGEVMAIFVWGADQELFTLVGSTVLDFTDC